MVEVGELIRELRHLTSLNEPRYGGPYEGVAAEACIEAMGNAAAALSALLSERDELQEALSQMASHYDSVARDAGMDPDAQPVALRAARLLKGVKG